GQTGPSDDPGPNSNCSNDPQNSLPSCSGWSPPTIATDPFRVAAACIPWAALGLSSAPNLVRVNDAITFSDSGNLGQLETILPTIQALPPSGGTCVLAAATDDYAHGGAELTDSSLAVHATDWLWPQAPRVHGNEFLWSSALCGLPLPFQD